MTKNAANDSTNSRHGSEAEDWDCSKTDSPCAGTVLPQQPAVQDCIASLYDELKVAGPEGEQDMCTKGKQSLIELLRLHAEKGTDCCLSAEEASKIGDVLGQWINASSSPYEGDDDFWARSRDDFAIWPRCALVAVTLEGRPRQSVKSNSRPATANSVTQS